jgi:hypothetical protein
MAYKPMRERFQEREREREMARSEVNQEKRSQGMSEALEVNRRELLRSEEPKKKAPESDGFQKLVEKLRKESKKRMESGEKDQSPDQKKSLLFDRISEAYDILEKKGRIGE